MRLCAYTRPSLFHAITRHTAQLTTILPLQCAASPNFNPQLQLKLQQRERAEQEQWREEAEQQAEEQRIGESPTVTGDL
jgi:hypothetical protein